MDIAFDRSGKQYFLDLYALVCLRTAVTTDGGATASQSVYPAGCMGVPGADRQWLAAYDPPDGTPNQSAYPGPRPLIYLEYNNLAGPGPNGGAQWNKSTDGLTYVNAPADVPLGTGAVYSPFRPDGYPSIDQVTGKVFQAEFNGSTIFLNIGTPDASGNPTFLDALNAANPSGDLTKLITVATNVPADANDSACFVVTSMDSARNLHVAWVGRSKTPSLQGASSAWLERLDDIQ